MRIGIDCRTILSPEKGERAGVGHYTYYLVKTLLALDKKNTYVLFFDHRSPNLKEFQRRNTEIVFFKYSQHKKYLPFAYSHVIVSRILKNAKLDVFHSPANVLPLQYSGPSVITFHDLAIYFHPEWFPPKQDFSIKVLVPKSLERANHIISVSQSTADDMQKLFKVPKKKISVVHEGIEKTRAPKKLAIRQVEKKHKITGKYILYVGTLEPRKNIAGIIQAFDELACKNPKKYKDIQLVLAGAKGFEFQKNYEAIKNAKSGKIRYVGYVSTPDKVALMHGAMAFIFPSLYEGFGLPALEAMSYGTPVITSNISSLPEVVGKAALTVKPQSIKDIQAAIAKLVSRKATRDSLVKKGKIQARKFSWEKCAKETLAVYTQVYEETR